MQADLKGNFGWEIPAVFLSLPGPILYIVLAVLGWMLWLTMAPGCDTYYESTVGLLYIIFHIQVSVRVCECMHACRSASMHACMHVGLPAIRTLASCTPAAFTSACRIQPACPQACMRRGASHTKLSFQRSSSVSTVSSPHLPPFSPLHPTRLSTFLLLPPPSSCLGAVRLRRLSC